MPRLPQLQRWLRCPVTCHTALTFVALVLLAPRALLAAAPGGVVMPSVSHVGSMSRAAKRSTPARSRFSYVTITRNGSGTVSVYTYASGSVTFTVRNDGAPLTALFSASICTGNITNCSASPSGTYLSTGASTTVTVSFTGGTTAGSGQLRLTARDASDNSVMNYYDLSVTVSVDPNAPTLSFSPHLGDRRDVSQCVADCFESTLSFTTPPYISLDVPRSATLLYRSGSAYPQGKLTLDANAPTAPAGSTFRLQLVDQNAAYVPFSNGTTALYFARNTTGPTRIVAQFDATQIPTSARLYSARVSTIKSDGSVFATAVNSVRIIVINNQNSPYGAGVSLVGVQRILFNQPDGALVTDGTGSATFFAGTCNVNTTCTYTSPSGEFSTLSTSGGMFWRAYPDGTNLSFYPDGHHFRTIDRFGSTSQVNYGWNGPYNDYLPYSITDPTGQSISFGYRDANWLYGWKLGSLGNIHTPAGDAPIAIDGSNNAVQWVELGGGTYRWRMTYLAQHLLDTAFAKDSSVWKHVYRYGATRAYVDAPAVVLDGGSIVRPRVQVRDAWAQLLDSAAAGRGTSAANALAVPVEVRASLTDARGYTTYYTTNRFGLPTKIEAPLVPPAYADYDSLTGQLKRSVSPTGHEVTFTYYSSGLLNTTTDNTLGKVDSVWYASKYGIVKAVKGTDGQQWFWYDSLTPGWPITKSAPTVQGPFTLHYQDAFGRDSLIVDPSGHRTSYNYASSGLRNLISVTAPNSQTTAVGRTAYGTVQSSTAPNGAAWTSSRDVLNRPEWVAGQYGDTTKYQYNALDQVAILTDAKGQADTLKRNALGWEVSHVYANGAADSTFYDAAGNVVRTKSRQGREVRYVYDGLSRLVKRTGVATQSVDSLWYDPNGKWVTIQSRIGSTVLSTDTDSTDEQSRRARFTMARPSGITWNVQTTFNSGDPDISSMTLNKRVNNSDSTVAFAYYRYYDNQKRLTAIESASDSAGFHYNGEGLVDTISLRSGLTEAFTFTSSHQLSTREYAGASWVDAVLRRWYRTDALQRIIERGGPDSLFQAFTYDSSGRLRSWAKKAERSGTSCISSGDYGYTCSGATPWLFSQVIPTYDKVGNPTDAGLNAVTTTGNRLTSFNGVTTTYDADGYMRTRVTSTTTDSLTWDEFGRLVSVKRVGQGQPTTFAYDGFGRRIKKTTASGNTTEYLWDEDQLVAELDNSSNVKKSYAYRAGTDKPRSVTTGGQTYFFSTEPDGTVDGLIRKSDRSVVAQYAYTPWGEFESTAQAFDSVSNLRWKGLLYDSETGFYYMRARYYDPKIRRFISEDPIDFDGGINVFEFANGDPVNFSDPTGLAVCKWVFYPGVFITTYDEFNGNTTLWTDPPRMEYQCEQEPARVYDDAAARGESGSPTGRTGTSAVDLSKSIQWIHANVSNRQFGEGACANRVRRALCAGGLQGACYGGPNAKDYGPFLLKLGFTPLGQSGYTPQPGDIGVMVYNPNGHVAMYDGSLWVSDFVQNQMQPNSRAHYPYTIYRR